MKQVVVIGSSLGGLAAVGALLADLPADFPVPLVLAQHRRADAEAELYRLLDVGTQLTVVEVDDRHPLLPGRVHVAPPDYHVLVDAEGLSLSTEAPALYARPSVDVLFESAAYELGAGVVGVVLTGSSEDGARGAAAIAARGGRVLVQDPETAESAVAPRAAIRACAATLVAGVPTLSRWLRQAFAAPSPAKVSPR